MAIDLACWCGGIGWDRVFVTPRFGLLRCQGCGGFRIDPPPVYTEIEAEQFYTAYYGTDTPIASATPEPKSAPGRTSRFWQVARRYTPLEEPRERALDVGCGDGTLCSELHAAGWQRVVGVDLSASRMAGARARYPQIDFRPGSIAELGWQEGNFDLIALDNVIEHLLDPVGTLSAIRDRLQPKGHAVVITPNMRSGQFRLLGRRWTPELAPHAHVFLFTPESLGAAVRMSGLKAVAWGAFHTPGVGLFRVLTTLLGGDPKASAWRALQGLGAAYAHMIGAGPMQFVVASPAARPEAVSRANDMRQDDRGCPAPT